MRSIFVADFGTNEEGVITYRINGEKHHIEEVINAAKALGYDFWEPPIVKRSRKHWSVLLKLFIPYDVK